MNIDLLARACTHTCLHVHTHTHARARVHIQRFSTASMTHFHSLTLPTDTVILVSFEVIFYIQARKDFTVALRNERFLFILRFLANRTHSYPREHTFIDGERKKKRKAKGSLFIWPFIDVIDYSFAISFFTLLTLIKLSLVRHTPVGGTYNTPTTSILLYGSTTLT